MEVFSCKTKIISGPGAVSCLTEMGIKKLFMVADPYFAENGEAKRIAALSGAGEIGYFTRIQPDPSAELAAEGTAQLRAFAPDTVVALGGGSTLDCAKAMVYFSGLPMRLVAIPTTSGSGSEITDFAILTHKEQKHPLVDEKLRPDVAVLDGDLLRKLPPKLVADTGFDALSHAVEAFVATGSGEITDSLAKSAFCSVFGSLSASFSGNISVRQRLHTASCMAGLAFTQAGLGLCHAMAHTLGGIFHIPHGRLNAILLPAVIRLNANICQEKYASLARSAGIGGSADSIAVRNLQNALVRLRTELKLPATLAQAGADPRELWHLTDSIVENTLKDPCCKTNPLLVEDFMVRRVLSEVAGRV